MMRLRKDIRRRERGGPPPQASSVAEPPQEGSLVVEPHTGESLVVAPRPVTSPVLGFHSIETSEEMEVEAPAPEPESSKGRLERLQSAWRAVRSNPTNPLAGKPRPAMDTEIVGLLQLPRAATPLGPAFRNGIRPPVSASSKFNSTTAPEGNVQEQVIDIDLGMLESLLSELWVKTPCKMEVVIFFC